MNIILGEYLYYQMTKMAAGMIIHGNSYTLII